MNATKANMDEHYEYGVFAYSPVTGEEYSANPGDYFMMADDDVLEDRDGNPMILTLRQTNYKPLV